MKVKLVVAHPDDCCIFAWPLINQTMNDWDWSIVYMTYTATDPRALEANQFWNQYNIETTFLGFEDHYRDLEQGFISTFNIDAARESIISNCLATHCDLIVTHNADGEYGHIHHMFIHNVLQDVPVPKIYFAGTTNATHAIQAPSFDLSQWPLHKEVIEGFQDRLTGRYQLPNDSNINFTQVLT